MIRSWVDSQRGLVIQSAVEVVWSSMSASENKEGGVKGKQWWNRLVAGDIELIYSRWLIASDSPSTSREARLVGPSVAF